MQIFYSELIEKFHDVLGTPKQLIEETFNKPDATDIVISRYISIKNFGDYYILIIFDLDNKIVRFLNAYKIYQKMMDGTDISKMKPLEVLTEFMNRYGIPKEISGFGEQKVFVEKRLKIFFGGVLDIERYLEAAKSMGY